MKTIHTLSKNKAVMESATDATENPTAADSGENQDLLAATFPIATTNFRRDFVEQAKQLKEKLVIGKTPERIEKPKNTYTLDSKGNLKGEMELVKDTGTTATIDLSKRAEAVNEGVKRPVFKHKSAGETYSNDLDEDSRCIYDDTVSCTDGSCSNCSSHKVIKDERESEDKQPKEAVACESRFPKFNKREQALISAGDASAVRREMGSGKLSTTRGRQILYTMGATEQEEPIGDVFTSVSTDGGKFLDNEEQDFKPCHCCCNCHGDSLIGVIDTEVGDEYDCDVSYVSRDPVEGQLTVKDADVADKITSVFEGLGLSAKVVPAKEEFVVLFKEPQVVDSSKWYALIADKQNPRKVSQVTMSVKGDATEAAIKEYLSQRYATEQILSVSNKGYN